MNAVLRYTVLRLMIFLGCLLVGWLAGLRDESQYVLLVVLAALASMAISYVALRRFREAYSAQLAESIERRTEGRQEKAGQSAGDEQAEDAEVGRRSGAGGSGAANAEDDDFR
jgi:hypothetical protein